MEQWAGEGNLAVLRDILQKTMAESRNSYDITLKWAVHDNNYLSKAHRFAPYQIITGYTPKLPSGLDNRQHFMEVVYNPSKIDVVQKQRYAT